MDTKAFRHAGNRKELELLRQEVWRALRDAIRAMPNSAEGVRLLIGVVGEVVDSAENLSTLVTVVNAVKGGILGDAYLETLKRGSA